MTRNSKNSRTRNAQRKGNGKNPKSSSNAGLPEAPGPYDSLGGVRVTLPGIGIPRRMIAHLRMEQGGYLAAGAVATANALIGINQYYQPFNTAIPITSATFGLNFVSGSSTTQLFVPNSFFSAGYDKCRVLNARLRATAICGASGDTMDFSIYPVSELTFNSQSMPERSGMPGYKHAIVTAQTGPVELYSKVHVCDVLGLTSQQYLDSADTDSLLTGSPVLQANWVVRANTLDGNVTTGQIYFTFEIDYDVEFFIPLNPLS